MDRQTSVTQPEAVAAPKPELPPAMRELLELERRQLVQRLKLIERLLGIAPGPK